MCSNIQNKSLAVGVCIILLLLSCGRLPEIVFLNDPLTAEEHNDLGVSYAERGKYTLAVREYKEALKIKKDFFNAQFNLGNVYLKMKQEEEAEKAYRKAIALDPCQPDAYNNLAGLYLQSRRNLDKAQQLAHKAVNLSGSRHYLYLDTLGMVCLGQGRVDDALVYLEEALESTPVEDKTVRVEIYKHLAEAYILKGEGKQAKKYEDQVVELTKGNNPL